MFFKIADVPPFTGLSAEQKMGRRRGLLIAKDESSDDDSDNADMRRNRTGTRKAAVGQRLTFLPSISDKSSGSADKPLHPRALSTDPIVPPPFKCRQKQLLLLKSGKYSLEIMRRCGELQRLSPDVVREACFLSRESGWHLAAGCARSNQTIAESVAQHDEDDIAKLIKRRRLMKISREEVHHNHRLPFSSPSTSLMQDCRSATSMAGDGDDDRTGHDSWKKLLNDDMLAFEDDEAFRKQRSLKKTSSYRIPSLDSVPHRLIDPVGFLAKKHHHLLP